MADPQEPPEKRPEVAPEAPAKKAPAKKAPAKKAAAKKAAPAKKAPAKAPAKKAPVKQAPVKAAPAPEAPAADLPAPAVPIGDGAKEAAAQAKSAVQQATDSVVTPLVPPAESTRSPWPLAAAIAVSLLAVLVIRRLRRG
jgi:hypothetical protein